MTSVSVSVAPGGGASTEVDIVGNLEALGTVELMLVSTLGVVESGDLVDTWEDQSSNGRNPTNAGGATRPTVGDFAPNGRPAIRFDGSATYLQETWAWDQPLYIFLVCLPSRSDSATNQIVMDGWQNWLLVNTQGTGADIRFYASADNIVDSSDIDTWQLIRCVADGGSGNSSLQINDKAPVTGDTAAASDGNGITLGAINTLNSWADCDIAALVVYSAISDTDAIAAELNSYFGL